jgi:hypothetical protein
MGQFPNKRGIVRFWVILPSALTFFIYLYNLLVIYRRKKVDRREAEERIRQMSITEQITKLSDTATHQVIDHIEQAISEEQRTESLTVEHTPSMKPEKF